MHLWAALTGLSGFFLNMKLGRGHAKEYIGRVKDEKWKLDMIIFHYTYMYAILKIERKL